MLRRFADARLRRQRDNYRALARSLGSRLKDARADLRAQIEETQEVAAELAEARAELAALNQEPDRRLSVAAPSGCDDCSVEPGERHRYPDCPGNERARLRAALNQETQK